ncbi:MAG: hypothetical protein K5986_08830 [Clostridium sp.]|uniref:hypothetical protein n=1 Tax=Clostridium sp. DSM 8431 TaxID=1761781 RepID=UPI001A9A4C64|nr:hypothetical protein [Clostridium sp. DSM 8431]MCR4944533.1 hypothetical protein [Clostridium sp.]
MLDKFKNTGCLCLSYNYLTTVIGAPLGGILGSLIKFNTEGISFVMTSMFIVILLEQWLK